MSSFLDALLLFFVSIHASVKDASKLSKKALAPYARFNPRVREGRDRKLMAGDWIKFVSIHASVKDATPSL